LSAPPLSRVEGVVAEYDDHAGFGEIEAGGRRYWFHCTSLLDGSRSTRQGQSVTFGVVPGPTGRWEAAEVAQPPPDWVKGDRA